MPDEMICGKWTIPVLYEDNHVLGLVKPANLPVQPDSSRDESLLEIAKAYIGKKYAKPGKVYLGLVHRLDRPVGGVMVFARTSKAAARLSADFAAHEQEKTYLAVVQGTIEKETRLTDELYWDGVNNTVSVVRAGTPGAKEAMLITRPICARENLTLASVTLLTGRKHQIRVQHANAGFPLWGDARYGGGIPGQQIALWAYRLAFTHPTLRIRITLTRRPPDEGAWRLFSDRLDEISREESGE